MHLSGEFLHNGTLRHCLKLWRLNLKAKINTQSNYFWLVAEPDTLPVQCGLRSLEADCTVEPDTLPDSFMDWPTGVNGGKDAHTKYVYRIPS